jgi:hypothetical protein
MVHIFLAQCEFGFLFIYFYTSELFNMGTHVSPFVELFLRFPIIIIFVIVFSDIHISVYLEYFYDFCFPFYCLSFSPLSVWYFVLLSEEVSLAFNLSLDIFLV